MLVNIRFQVLFHSPPGVLFTFPSQYCSSIGHQLVFRLGGWSPRLPYRFLVSVSTPDPVWFLPSFAYETFTLSGQSFQNCSATRLIPYNCPYPVSISTLGLASSDFARHYSRNLVWFLFLCLLRCFSSAGSPCWPMNSVSNPQLFTARVSPFGYSRVVAYFQLTVTFRRLSRPSSALGAKAFTLCSFSLEQLPCFVLSTFTSSLFCLSFANNCFGLCYQKDLSFF